MPDRTPPEIMTTRWWSKYLDIRAFLVFQRILRFYNTFVVLAALISGLSLAALSFGEFHPSTGLCIIGEGFFSSSAMTSIIAAVVATMLLFMFEGVERATRLELAIAWTPLLLLDLSVVEFLVGMTCWYCEKNKMWRGTLMATQLGVLLLFCIGLSTWMWFYMSRKGGLGREESDVSAAHTRAADN